MSMTEAQTAAFQGAAGYTPQLSSGLWISLTLVIALLWCSWALWTGYRGWAAGQVSFGALGGSAARVSVALLVLMFFTLS